VYRDLAVEPVVRFIEALPEGEGRGAVPFVTWGAACSGVALWQMGDALLTRGWRVVAAAKVLAQHSLMWRSADAPGKGHPDGADDLLIAQLVDNVCARLQTGGIPPLSLDALDYHPAGRSSQMRKKIGAPRLIVPKKADQSRCSQCGDCVAACPAAAVTLAPFPEFTTDCLDCFNCIRLCPEEAITPAVDLAQIENHIRERVRTIDERPPSQIFLP
jgi:ferredoxin